MIARRSRNSGPEPPQRLRHLLTPDGASALRRFVAALIGLAALRKKLTNVIWTYLQRLGARRCKPVANPNA